MPRGRGTDRGADLASGVLASAPASHRSGESRSNRRSVGVGAGVDVNVTRTRETLA
jgi:hypothetical protein